MSEPAKDLDPRPKVDLPLRSGGKQTVRLTVPESMATRYDIWLAAASNFQRASAAALGLTGGPKVAGKARYRGDVLDYGGDVIDHLVAQGVPYTSILAAAATAYQHVTDGLAELTAEVDAAEGNSEAPSATSTE